MYQKEICHMYDEIADTALLPTTTTVGKNLYTLEDTRYIVAIWFAYKSDSQPSPSANALPTPSQHPHARPHHLPYSVNQ